MRACVLVGAIALGLLLGAGAANAEVVELPLDLTVQSADGDAFGADKYLTPITFRTLLQVRQTQTSGASGSTAEKDYAQQFDGWHLQRMFLRAATRPTSWMEGKILADFAEAWNGSPKKLLKLAYADIDLHERVHLRVGLQKLPMSLLELLPIAEFELADLGAVDDLIKDTGFGGRDVGATLRVDPLPKARWLRLSAGAFSGDAVGTDASLAPLLGFRAESHPWKHLSAGIDWLWRRHATTAPAGSPTKYIDAGSAGSADISLHWKPVEVRAELVWGDRTDARYRLDPVGGEARSYLGAWLIAVGRIKLGKVIVRPVARCEVLDADREHASGRRTLISGALDVDVGPVRVVLDVSQRLLQPGSVPLGQQVQGDVQGGVWRPWSEVGSTRVVLQLQVAI